MSGTCRGTLREVQDGSGDPRGGLGRVWGPSGKSRTCRETLGVVRNGSETSGTDRGTHGEFRDGWGTLGEFRDGSGDPRGGRGWVWRP